MILLSTPHINLVWQPASALNVLYASFRKCSILAGAYEYPVYAAGLHGLQMPDDGGPMQSGLHLRHGPLVQVTHCRWTMVQIFPFKATVTGEHTRPRVSAYVLQLLRS